MTDSLRIWIAIQICIALAYSTEAVQLPEYIHVCHRSDPNIDKCIKNAVHDIRPYLADGIKDLSVPPLEPLFIGNLNIVDSGQGGFTVKTKNLNIYGAANFEIKKLKATNEGQHIEFEVLLPKLRGEGNYDVKGQLLGLPIQGNGRLSGNFTNFTAFVQVVFELKADSEVEHIMLKSLNVKIRTGKGRIRLYNLFNGDKALGDVINTTINDNFEAFAVELIPPIERELEKKFSTISNQILASFRYDDLLPN